MIPNFFPSDPRFYLREELSLRQARRPQYSLRAFARDLEMSPSFLCEFLAGRQGISRERVHWLAKKLSLPDEQREHFWDLIESKFGRSLESKKMAGIRVVQRSKSHKSKMSLDRFRLVADWYNFVILEILSLPDTKYSPKAIAEILGIPEKEVRQSISRLKALELINEEEVNGEPRWLVTEDVTSTEEGGNNSAVQHSHQQMLQMQAGQIEKKGVDARESVSVTFSLSDSDWPEFRRELKEALLSVVSKYGMKTGGKDQVACLSTQVVKLLERNQQ